MLPSAGVKHAVAFALNQTLLTFVLPSIKKAKPQQPSALTVAMGTMPGTPHVRRDSDIWHIPLENPFQLNKEHHESSHRSSTPGTYQQTLIQSLPPRTTLLLALGLSSPSD